MGKNIVNAYVGDDFSIQDELETIPESHQLAILRDIEKLARYPYKSIIRCGVGFVGDIKEPLGDQRKLLKLTPRASNQTQYRLPFVSFKDNNFTILNLFKRAINKKEYKKQIKLSKKRYDLLKKYEANQQEIEI